MRQTVMVVVVGLIVARPLVLGEDPGLVQDQSDPGGLVLTMIWFAAAAAWGLWRVWARQDDLYAGLVEAGLGAVVILVFCTAYGVAAYQHPARLISWEWLAMLVALFLVRQLTIPVEEQHGLLSAMLASVLTLSVLGLYQASEGLAKMEREIPTQEALHEKLLKEGTIIAADDPSLAPLFKRIKDHNIFATFVHPNSYAGYLALLLPALFGTAFLSVRGVYPAWQKALAVLFALAGAAALWCTHSRGAIAAVALVSLALGAIVYRRELWSHKVAAGIGVGVLLAAAVGLYAGGVYESLNTLLGKSDATAAVRGEYWKATWHMIQERPWFGFGPGNFGRVYSRFMSETAGDQITDPHNFALEMWATSGIFAMIALLIALAAFFVVMVRSARATPVEAEPPPPPPPATPDDLPPIRWTFYIGGMFGMLMGFALRISYQPHSALMDEAIMAGVQSVVWFASFALFEQIRWTRHARALVLTGGVAALLLNLSVSGGIGFPAVAGMMWVVVGLALNTLAPQPWRWPSAALVLRYVPAPLLISLAILYFVGVFLPVTSARHTLRLFVSSDSITSEKIIPALEEATKTDDPDNVALHVVLAEMYGNRWQAAMYGFGKRDQSLEEQRTKALDYATRAQEIDPYGRAGYMEEYNLRLRFANTYRDLEMQRQGAMLGALLGRKSMQLGLGLSARALSDNSRFLQILPWEVTNRQLEGAAAQFALGNVSSLAADGVSPWGRLDSAAAQLALGGVCPAVREVVRNAPEVWRSYPWNNAQGPAAGSYFQKFKEVQRSAAEVLLRYLPNDPNNPRLHFDIAQALYRAEYRLDGADQHARLAQSLDANAAPSSRKLTDPQRMALRRRLPPDLER